MAMKLSVYCISILTKVIGMTPPSLSDDELAVYQTILSFKDKLFFYEDTIEDLIIEFLEKFEPHRKGALTDALNAVRSKKDETILFPGVDLGKDVFERYLKYFKPETIMHKTVPKKGAEAMLDKREVTILHSLIDNSEIGKLKLVVELISSVKEVDQKSFLAFLNDQDEFGYSALYTAIASKKPKMVDYLLSKGSRTDLRTKSNLDALELAEKIGVPNKIVELLKTQNKKKGSRYS